MSGVWAPPSAQEYPAQPSTAVDALMNRIKKLEGLVAELTKGSPLRQAGMGVSPGQVDFDGNVVISGTLSLPAGIIDNDALANPLAFSADSANGDGFAIPLAETTVASRTLLVPAGFTTAVVQGIGSVFGMNTSAALDYLFARVYIDWPGGTAAGRQLITPLTASNGSGSLSVNRQQVITGLTAGQPVTVRIAVKSSFTGLPAAPQNGASINVMATWAR